jgi:hypothetical protein
LAATRTLVKICHVTTRFIRGGAEENVLYSCNGQAAAHDVHLVVGNDASEDFLERLDDRVTLHQVPVLQRSVSARADVLCFVRLVGLFASLRPDLVHTHQSKAGIIGRLAAAAVQVPIVVHGVHILPFVNVHPLKALVYRGLERAVAGVTDAFVDVGEEMRSGCLAAGIGSPGNHFVIRSGMDVGRFRRRAAHQWRDVLPGLDPRIEHRDSGPGPRIERRSVARVPRRIRRTGVSVSGCRAAPRR